MWFPPKDGKVNCTIHLIHGLTPEAQKEKDEQNKKYIALPDNWDKDFKEDMEQRHKELIEKYKELRPKNSAEFMEQFNNYYFSFKNTDDFLKSNKNKPFWDKNAVQSIIAMEIETLCRQSSHLLNNDEKSFCISTLKAMKEETQDAITQMRLAKTVQWLQQKLKQLPSNQYLVLHLRQVEKKSMEEIAAIVGITPQSAATLLSRARQRMLQEIRKKNQH